MRLSMTKRSAIIVDIDGTVADCTHRRGELPNWKKFFEKMGEDPPMESVVKLIKPFLQAEEWGGEPVVLFVSGRPDEYREITLRWLRLHVYNDFFTSRLFMRKTGDYRSDAIVKKEILEEIREDYEPFLSIDDRSTVVSMWRENGIFCLQAPDQTISANPAEKNPFIPEKGECLLTLMVGPSGGGKSTYAQEHFHHASILESDQLRAEICGDFKDQTRNKDVFTALHAVASVRMQYGLPVVIDATHLKRKDRLAAVALAPGGSTVRYVVVDRPLADKLVNRGWRSEELVKKHDQSFKSSLPEILEGDYLSNVVVVAEIDGGSHVRA